MKRFICFVISVYVIISALTVLSVCAESDIDPSLIVEKISDEGKAALSETQIPVKLCLVCGTEENKDSILEYFLSLLSKENELLSSETFISGETSDEEIYGFGVKDIADNSVVLISEKRKCIVPATDIYRFYAEGYGYLTYEEYQMANQMYYLQYGQNMPVRTVFSGEVSVIPAAVYVGSDTLPVIYALKGHGEAELSEIINKRVQEEKIDILPLDRGEDIPQDAEGVLINVPSEDIDAEERDMLHSYIIGGGDVILLTDLLTYSSSSMPNLSALASYMGMTGIDGLVIEGDSERTYKYGGNEYPYIISPYTGNETSTPVSLVNNKSFLSCMCLTSCHGIEYSGKKGALFCPILSSGKKSYVKIGAGDDKGVSTYEYEDKDRRGPVVLGAVSVLCDEEGNYTSGAFVWYATPSITEAPIDPVFVGMSYLFGASIRMAAKNELEIKDTDIDFPEETQTESSIPDEEKKDSGFGVVTIITVTAGILAVAAVVVCAVVFTKKKSDKTEKDKN